MSGIIVYKYLSANTTCNGSNDGGGSNACGRAHKQRTS